MKRNTLVINYRHMGNKQTGVGGVENYIIGLIRLAHNNGNRIIWIHDVKTFISPIYEDILNSDYVEKCACDIHKYHWFRHDKLRFNSDENVVIISFSAIGITFYMNCVIKKNLYYLVPSVLFKTYIKLVINFLVAFAGFL